MESLGEYLKRERESQHLTLKEISESTKIREYLLGAIERNQYELLSSPFYVKAFLDAYIRYLGLDPNDIGLRYQQYPENVAPSKGTEVKPGITSTNRRGYLWLLFLSAIIFFLGGLIYYFSRNPIDHFFSFFGTRTPAHTTSPPAPSSPPVQEDPDTQPANPPGKAQD
jgi:cytoskeletal protein RodZ